MAIVSLGPGGLATEKIQRSKFVKKADIRGYSTYR